MAFVSYQMHMDQRYWAAIHGVKVRMLVLCWVLKKRTLLGRGNWKCLLIKSSFLTCGLRTMEGCKFYQILNFFFEKPTADQILNFTEIGRAHV